jgi:hypothetical protein
VVDSPTSNSFSSHSVIPSSSSSSTTSPLSTQSTTPQLGGYKTGVMTGGTVVGAGCLAVTGGLIGLIFIQRRNNKNSNTDNSPDPQITPLVTDGNSSSPSASSRPTGTTSNSKKKRKQSDLIKRGESQDVILDTSSSPLETVTMQQSVDPTTGLDDLFASVQHF